MQQSHSNGLLNAFDESSGISQSNRMLLEAFEALPDLVFLFSADRRLIHTNAAASRVQSGELAMGKGCCEMFWHVEGADGCVVDRAMQTAEKVEVEILAGAEGESSISIIVEPLKSDNNGMGPGALVIARDISDLRRAEAEAIQHKSYPADALRLMTNRMQESDVEVSQTVLESLASWDLRFDSPDAFQTAPPAVFYAQAVDKLRKYVRLLGSSLANKNSNVFLESLKTYRIFAEQHYCEQQPLISKKERDQVLASRRPE